MASTQNFKNHARFYPLWHFIAFPILAINVVRVGGAMIEAPSVDTVWSLLVAIAIFLGVYTARVMALKNQDRIIVNEERARLLRLLPDATHGSLQQFTRSQLIGLRFASDDELPDLAQRVLKGDFDNQKAIKAAVQNWRADLVRV
jgi:hypothetical protein